MADSLTDGLRRAAADLKAMSKEVRKEVRPAIRRAAKPMLDDARANAAWSSRIPRAIRLSITKRGVDIRVSQRRAPHARPFEGIGGNTTFRHPVFGRDRWVSQATRPFLDPAVKKHRRKVREELSKVVDDAARRHGYR